MSVPRLCFAACLLVAAAARELAAQPALEPAVKLYEAADYEQSLTALDAASVAVTAVADRVSIDHYRVLCLLALGRTVDAQTAVERLLRLHPTYRLDDESSPRVRTVFDQVRTRLLPDLIRSRYATAKRQFDAKQFADAVTGFAIVAELRRSAPTEEALEPSLRDLLELAAGFGQLATVAAEAERVTLAREATAGPDTGPTPATASSASPAATSPSNGRAAPPAAAPAAAVEYVLGAAGVTPPVALNQQLSAWHRALPRPRAGAPLGTIEVVVDEKGAVLSARIVSSVSAFYDAVLLDSARTWRYKPATKDGVAVRFRRVVAMLSGG
jgi:TonB family protein